MSDLLAKAEFVAWLRTK